ncbi:MAG: hypothetical protein ACI8X5_003841 [Planctomycetota bacterium]|jgi:hypothetical protein
MNLAAHGLVLFGILACTACRTNNDLYQWSGYEDSVADVCLDAGQGNLDEEIQSIVELIERAAEVSRRVPPGAHAHLGYLYYLKGDLDGAVAGLTAEKEAYVESTVFVDGLLARIQTRSREQ